MVTVEEEEENRQCAFSLNASMFSPFLHCLVFLQKIFPLSSRREKKRFGLENQGTVQ